MDFLDWRFAGRERNVIQLSANLERGWRDLSKPGKKHNYWGFDESIKADCQMNSLFRCHLYVAATAPHSWPSVQSFPTMKFLGRLGDNSVSIDGPVMVIDVPLTQGWRLSQQGRPMLYEISDQLFQSMTTEGSIDYRVQLWVVYHGDEKMFVKNEREWGDGFAWVGGRPESNRRKF